MLRAHAHKLSWIAAFLRRSSIAKKTLCLLHSGEGSPPFRGSSKTHLPGKIALLKPFASIFLGQLNEGRPRQMERGSFTASCNWTQNNQFFRAKQFCNYLSRKAVCIITLLLLVFSLTGCRGKGWFYSDVKSDCARFNSALLSHCSPEAFNGIELQLLRGEFGILAFLNISSGSLNSPTAALEIEGIRYLYTAHVMQGGQRVLLPPEAADFIITSLLNGLNVKICLNGYMSEFFPENFARKYKCFSRQ